MLEASDAGEGIAYRGGHRREGVNNPLSILAPAAKCGNNITSRLNFSFLDLALAQGKYLKQRHSLLCLLIAVDVLHYSLRLAVLHDH